MVDLQLIVQFQNNESKKLILNFQIFLSLAREFQISKKFEFLHLVILVHNPKVGPQFLRK